MTRRLGAAGRARVHGGFLHGLESRRSRGVGEEAAAGENSPARVHRRRAGRRARRPGRAGSRRSRRRRPAGRSRAARQDKVAGAASERGPRRALLQPPCDPNPCVLLDPAGVRWDSTGQARRRQASPLSDACLLDALMRISGGRLDRGRQRGAPTYKILGHWFVGRHAEDVGRQITLHCHDSRHHGRRKVDDG